jgi:hypothetical protein
MTQRSVREFLQEFKKELGIEEDVIQKFEEEEIFTFDDLNGMSDD